MLRRPMDRDAISLLREAEVLVTERNVPVTRAMIEAADRLKLIVRLGSLSHDIDVAAAAARGIVVVRQPVEGAIYAAEHVMMMILAVLRRLPSATFAMTHPRLVLSSKSSAQTSEDQFAYDWSVLPGVRPLRGANVAIFGMGEIGVELAWRLAAFSPASHRHCSRGRTWW